MNWKQRLFKPKWQHKDAEVRLAAVSAEQDPQLINSLVEIAGNDPDARVRCAAIKRLHQLGNILKLYANETDATAKALLEARIRQLGASSGDDRPPLELRMQLVDTTTDRDLIEHLASHAPEAELRRAALAKVSRQGLLGDCSIKDPDAENRRLAAARITQHKTLKRVIDGLRKRDKVLYAELQERLHKELMEKADPKAVHAEALRICVDLEHHAIEHGDNDRAEIKTLHQAWQGIAKSVTTDMSDRYQRICERLEAPAPVKQVTPPEPAEQALPSDSADEEPTKVVQTPLANLALAQLATEICVYDVENPQQPKAASVSKFAHQLEKIWARCQPPHTDDQVAWDEAGKALQHMQALIKNNEQLSAQELGQADELLRRLVQELEDGELHKALATKAELQQCYKERQHGDEAAWKQINGKLAGMAGRLRELREWQQWSNSKVRNRLISDMESLPAADLHPDALLERIKSLQVEWKTLEQSEQIPGEKHFSAAPWMWRKFSAAGNTAFDTVKPYLDKRSEIQSRNAQSLATFCAELEQLASADPTDWIALGKAMTRGRKKLHDLNNVPARQRQSIARKLKSALDKGNKAIQDHYQLVEKEKMKLIRSASQLNHLPERSEAITQAKALQSQWKSAGSLWRSKEQELWNQFREYLDPLFSELKEQQATIRAADDERLAVQKTLCADLKDILKSATDLAAQHGKVQGLQDAWKDIEFPDRKLQASFQAMVEDYRQRELKAQQQQVNAERERIWLKSALLHELTVSGRTKKGTISKKTESKVSKTWPDLSAADPFEISLDKACAAILAGQSDGVAADTAEQLASQARALCIRLEFVAGLQSPAEDQDQRMQYQVDRLAESMSGESSRQPAVDEAYEAEKTWLAMYAIPEAEFELFGKRIKQALTAITES